MSDLAFYFWNFYSKQIVIRFAGLIEIVFYILVLTLPFQKAKYFGRKLSAIIPLIVPLILLVSVINSLYPYRFTGMLNVFIYLVILVALNWLYRENLPELLLCLCGGLAIQIIVGRLYEILILWFNKNPYETISLFDNFIPIRDWTLYYLIHFTIGLILALLFYRSKVYEHDQSNRILIVTFSVTFILITTILTSFSRSFEGENGILDFIIRIFSILYALLTLLLRTRILETSKLKQDLLIMDELLYSEKKQYDSMRNELEIINLKTHDLRQQLSNISYKLTNQELESLHAAIEVYDATFKTGNEILDVILYKKQLYCEKEKIRMSCIANGECLSFISPTHLYSLLSNAIENAIEAVRSLSNEEKKVISIFIGEENGIVTVHVTNYFQSELIIKDQLPQTSKKDKKHHGFGIKSMRHIAEQYNGTLSFHTENDIFYLHIYFPTA